MQSTDNTTNQNVTNQKTNKISGWMIFVIIIFGSILGGIIAALVDAFILQKRIDSVWSRFGIMLIIAFLFSVIIYLFFRI